MKMERIPKKVAAGLLFFYGLFATSIAASVDNETTTFLSEDVLLPGLDNNNIDQGHISSDVPQESSIEVASMLISSTAATIPTQLGHTTMATEPVRHGQGRGIPVPHFHTSSRWGPFFEAGQGPYNTTSSVGATVLLDCRIGMLQDRTVTWLHHKEDSIHLLTVGRSAYSSDARITLSFRYPNNFRLQIVYVTKRDEGLYECQVATHPPKVKKIFLEVTAPEAMIVDESGRNVTDDERYIKAGSALGLTCLAKYLKPALNSTIGNITWILGVMPPNTVSFNTSTARNTTNITLTITRLEKGHSGNYTCASGNQPLATVVVHVLNGGELPAAVHDSNGVASKQLSSGVLLVLLAAVFLSRHR